MPVRFSLLVTIIQCLMVLSASAQVGGAEDAVSRALALSADGRFPAVVALLTPYVQDHPEDAEARLLLAQHQYWSGNVPEARQSFETALQHHPAHEDLRIAYARFLMENEESRRAKAVLQPLGRHHADAETLRGTIAWWAGNLSAAVRHFNNALRADPTHSDAASSLATLRAGARPWIRVTGRGGTDSQPLLQQGVTAEAGLFITPLQTLRTEAVHKRFAAAGSAESLSGASLSYRSFWPSIKLETDLGVGIVSRIENIYWTGRIGGGVRLPYGLRADVRVERAPYLYTVASITESVMTSTVEAKASLDKAGWLGEAAVLREYFPDENVKDVVYGWLMAPLLRTGTVTLQSGYAYNYQNALENRFTPVMSSAPAPGRPPTWTGRYVPYYTPLNLHVHSVTASLAVQPLQQVSVRVGGSVGVAGSEDAPYVYLAGRAPRTGLYEHDIRPWNVRGGLTAAVHPSVTVEVEASHMATSWYDASTLALSLYVRF